MSFLDRIFAPARPGKSTRGVSVDLFDDEFIRRLDTLALMSRRASGGMRRGERRSKKRGGGVEFADHRNYVAGDDIRFLDLGVYQRFGKLLIRLFEQEEDMSLYVLIDTSSSMAFAEASKLNQAVKVAAALSYIGLSGLDRVSLYSLSSGVESRVPPLRGRRRVFQVLRFLSELTAQGQTDLGRAMRTFVAQHKRRGLVILLTDLYDPHGFEAGINVLRFNKFEPVVLQLTDPRDLPGDLRGDLRVVDIESGASREVSMNANLLFALREKMRERDRHIARYCAERGVAHFLVDTNTPYDEVVLRVLRRGGLLR